MLLRAREIAFKMESDEKDVTLRKLGSIFVEAGLWDEAIEIINAIDDVVKGAEVLCELLTTLANEDMNDKIVKMWQSHGTGELLVDRIVEDTEQDKALRELGRTLVKVQLWEQAKAVIDKMDQIKRAGALRELANGLTAAGLPERAEDIIKDIKDDSEKARAWRELGTVLVGAQKPKDARNMWHRAKESTLKIEDIILKIDVLRELIMALVGQLAIA
jgi:lipopolysaccharide biosynthesis regulator YciM